MSTFEENVSFSFMFNLTQQNIQEIVLSMFNLFAQNVQNQTQTKTIEAIIDVVTIAKKSSFRVSDVKFFDSQLNLFYDSDDVVQIKRDLYYRNVYLFVERVKIAVIMFDVEIVRTNLSACLRETTHVWYIEDLSDIEKKALRIFEDDADHWCNVLLKKFKKSVASTLNYLITERYTLDDVRANRDISSFVFQIMRHVKTINIIDLHEQLTWTYNVIVSKLTKNIDSFDENIFTMPFLKNLKTKKNTWHRIYRRKLNISRIESESSQYQINFSNFSLFAYKQTIYTQKQYRSSFENVNEARNFQKFSSSENAYQKDKIFQRSYENVDELNQNTQTTFETQQVRNQTISAWRQNASQENTINWSTSRQSQAQLSAINASITLTKNRQSLNQFNSEEREQDFRNKREQFQKFYDNREQSMKTYVDEKSQKNENNVLNQNESFEDID
jgi:hypothetical protein